MAEEIQVKKKYMNKKYPLEEIPGKLKICSCCKKAYPQTNEYFSKHFNYPTGLFHKCKFCCRVKRDENFGKHYKNRVAINIIDNTQICKNCGEELPLTNDYYSIKKSNPSGYSRVCKKCNIERRNKNILLMQPKLENGQWMCTSCKKIFPLTRDNFCKRSDSITGFQYRCKTCMHKDPARYLKYSDPENLQRYINDILQGIKNRAKKKNLQFDIDSDFINDLFDKQSGRCAISKEKMTYIRTKGKIRTNLSVDRIIPSMGYIRNNIQLVCNVINMMKSDMSMNDLKYYCSLILQNNE